MDLKSIDISKLTVKQIADLANKYEDKKQLIKVLEKDNRASVEAIKKKLINQYNKENAEAFRTKSLYDYQSEISGVSTSLILGLDEVGRGPLAGPLVVGGVVLKNDDHILGLNDSKKINPQVRKKLSSKIKQNALTYSLSFVSAKYIDDNGMTKALIKGYSDVIHKIEIDGIVPNTILLDGNPLNLDKREINVIKGDGKCASIAAASIVAKVARDKYMIEVSADYPYYNFAKNKGYGTQEHIDAIKKYGICKIHRQSFTKAFNQMSFM